MMDPQDPVTAATGLALFLAGNFAMQLLVAAKRSRNQKPVGKVAQVIIYPVKSCLGVSVDSATVEEAGLVYRGVMDRGFAVVSTESGKVISVKVCPRLSLIQPVFDASSPTGLRLTAIAPSSVSDSMPVSLSPTSQPPLKLKMFGVTSHGRLCSPEVNQWLQTVCQRPDLVLVHCQTASRSTGPELREFQRLGIASTGFVASELPACGDSLIAFADTAPLLIVTEAALQAVNRRLSDQGKPGVDERNFRPNLVLAGPTEDRVEETWSYLYIRGGSCILAILSSCTRCGVTTVDYRESEVGKLRSDGEPLNTLSGYRKDGAFRKFSPVFGVNGFVEREGKVSVGCEVFAIDD